MIHLKNRQWELIIRRRSQLIEISLEGDEGAGYTLTAAIPEQWLKKFHEDPVHYYTIGLHRNRKASRRGIEYWQYTYRELEEAKQALVKVIRELEAANTKIGLHPYSVSKKIKLNGGDAL